MSDHDREWIIGCIKHDGFIKTDRFDKANHIILDALEKNIDAEIARLSRPTDYISRADAIEAVSDSYDFIDAIKAIEALPSADAELKMTEEVREALMRLTMCAREECDMCKYKEKCGFEFQYNISTENMNTLLDALSADAVPQLRQTDTLIIADALRYLAKDTERHLVDRTRADALRQQFLKYGASMCKGGDNK